MTLVIGYGNTLCGDDGVGVYLAEALLAAGPPAGVTVVTAHQLYPEMAEAISAAQRALFLDARVDGTPGEIRQLCLVPLAGDGAFVHRVLPGHLLQLAALLYGTAPPAELITLTGQNFEIGDDFSPVVRARLPEMLARVRAALGPTA